MKNEKLKIEPGARFVILNAGKNLYSVKLRPLASASRSPRLRRLAKK